MLAHYLKVALANARRQKGYSAITISGLAIGMACCILILVFVVTELSYDRYHENAGSIYRLCSNLTLGGTPNAIATTNTPPARVMPEEFPEVRNGTRFRKMPKVTVRHEDRQFYEERILYADDSVFEVFTFPMVLGDPGSALETAYTVVLTEETARRYFGGEDPMGKVLRINDQDDFTVTGIVEKPPSSSHFVFDMLCSFETLYARNREMMESWSSNFGYFTYLLLEEKADAAALEAKLPAMVEKYMGDDLRSFGAALEYFLQPLTEIHLHSELRHELAANSDVRYVYIFAAVALAILLIACFNFMNLATARSSARAREVAVRKVLGADRRELVKQFLAESLLYSFVSLALAVLLAHLALPWVGQLLATDSTALSEGTAALAERSFRIDYVGMPWLAPAFLGLALLVGLVAGSYPALFLASFRPSAIMSGGWKAGRGSSAFRRLLVTLQLSISVALMIATAIVFLQLDFMRTIPLGFDKEQVVVVSLMDEKVRTAVPSIKAELERYEGVIAVAASSHAPGDTPSGGTFAPEGYPEGQSEMMDRIIADPDYLPTLGMEIAAGRNFSRDFPSDETEAILINEAAARKFGWKDPVGKTISLPDGSNGRQVLGVVRDFHFSSPHRLITPIYISYDELRYRRNLFVRIKSAGVPATLEHVGETMAKFDPNRPFEYSFLDEAYDRQYGAEEKLSTLFAVFTLLAIVIACLGLVGIASFSVERRKREIGVRKVLGASVPQIVLLLSRELVLLSAIALLVAWPVAYLVMRKWLEAFPLRASLSPLVFLAAGVLMLVIALATVSYHTVRAGRANPVEALRHS